MCIQLDENTREIYKLSFPDNKVYIGQCNSLSKHGKIYGAKGRLRNHKCESRKPDKNSKLYKAIRLFGEDNIQLEILLRVNTKKEANEYETKFINLYDSKNNGYNSFIKGNPVTRASKITCQKQIKSRKMQVIQSPSDDTRERISKTLLTNDKTPDHHGRQLPMHISYTFAKDREGYKITESHPIFKGTKRTFQCTTSKFIKSSPEVRKSLLYMKKMDELLLKCTLKLEEFNALIK